MHLQPAFVPVIEILDQSVKERKGVGIRTRKILVW